jgi:DNA-binding transcriptional regulator YiaG
MDKAKQEKLEQKGWKFGSAADFLQMSSEEQAYVEMRVALSQGLKAIRKRKRISQARLARMIGSSQSRVAKMEAASPSVSIDLMIKSMIALGASKKEVANVISSEPKAA